MNDTKILDKLAKIKALAENAGTEGEAMTAAKMLNELLTKYKLEMTDIEYELEVKDEPVDSYTVGGGTLYKDGKYTYKDYPDVEIKRKRCEWSEDLARMISHAYGCEWLLRTGSSVITFVGRKSNVAIVEYMYITMYRTIESLSWKEYKTARNKVKWAYIKNFPKAEQAEASKDVDYSELDGYRSSWIEGFVRRVREMLEEMKRANQAPANSTALIRINQDAIATRQWMDERYGDKAGARSLQGSYRYNSAGMSAGRAKANEVGLTARGMNKGGTAKQLG